MSRRQPICARSIVISKFLSGGKSKTTIDGTGDFALEELEEIISILDKFTTEKALERCNLLQQLSNSDYVNKSNGTNV